ncbi:MAG: hypothetical protein ACQESG_05210 [Nanobdellota archaeon]
MGNYVVARKAHWQSFDINPVVRTDFEPITVHLTPIKETLIDALAKDPLLPLYNLGFASFERAKRELEELKDVLRFSVNIDYELIGKTERKYFIAFEEYNRRKCVNFIRSHPYSFISQDIEYFDIDFNMVYDSELEETRFLDKLKRYGITEILLLKTSTLIEY